MSSNSFQITRNAHLNPLAQRYNAESAEGPETSTESNAKTVFTGEFRTPIRERIQSMRRSKGVPAPVRPGTPVPDKRIRPTTPQTPAALPHMPECPGAPRKSKVYNLRLHGQGHGDDDDDILLDRKGTNRPAMFLQPTRGAGPAVTPEGRSPLRQSWSPNDLVEINAKLQALLLEPAADDTVKTAKPVCSELLDEKTEAN